MHDLRPLKEKELIIPGRRYLSVGKGFTNLVDNIIIHDTLHVVATFGQAVVLLDREGQAIGSDLFQYSLIAMHIGNRATNCTLKGDPRQEILDKIANEIDAQNLSPNPPYHRFFFKVRDIMQGMQGR